MSNHLINNPHVVLGSDKRIHAIGNVIVMTIDELTPDWSTYCIDIAPQAPGPFVGMYTNGDTYTDTTLLQKFIIKIKEKSTSTTTQIKTKTEDSISTQVMVKEEDLDSEVQIESK